MKEKAAAWQRTASLIGEDGLSRLQNAHIMVAGLGGVGSYTIEALTRTAVGTLSLIDGDRIAASNINRQLLALPASIGQLKTEAAADRLRAINPRLKLRLYSEWITADNAASFLEPKPDFLVDAIDDLPAKAALLAAALAAELPLVSVLGTGNRVQPFAQFQLADISKTHTCPLARALRKRLKGYGIERGIAVIFSPLPPESPTAERCPDEDAQPQRRPPSSISYLPGQAGLLAAGVAIHHLLNESS